MAQAFISNQGTQTNLLVDTTGGTSASGTSIPVMKVSIDAGGTYTGPWTGNVGVSSGTITTLPNLPQGSINVTAGTIATLGTMGTLGLVNTVTTVSNLTNGSINVTAGTIATLGTMGTLGTVQGLGTLPGVGVVSSVTNGSIVVTNGTVVGKDANAVAQTANPVSIGGTDSGGTVRTTFVDTQGHLRVDMPTGTISVLPNLPQGSIQVTAGTIATLGTMGTLGTVQNLGSVTNIGQVYNAGTLQAGTINTGTFRADARTTQNIVSFGTQFSGTAAIAGTIIGSASVGAGTSLWVNDVSIMNPYGSVLCVLGFGTAQQGTNVLFRGILGTQTAVGIEKPYPKMVNAGMTNQDLVFSLGAAGTIDLSFSYLIST